MNEETLNEFWEIFAQDGDQILSETEESLLELERDLGNREALNRLYRAMHTLKGNSRMMGLSKLEGFTHHLEDLLDCLKQLAVGAYESPLDLLFETLDILLHEWPQIIAERRDVTETLTTPILEKVEVWMSRFGRGSTPGEALQSPAEPASVPPEEPADNEIAPLVQAEDGFVGDVPEQEKVDPLEDPEFFGIFLDLVSEQLGVFETAMEGAAKGDADAIAQLRTIADMIENASGVVNVKSVTQWSHDLSKALKAGAEKVVLESLFETLDREHHALRKLLDAGSEQGDTPAPLSNEDDTRSIEVGVSTLAAKLHQVKVGSLAPIVVPEEQRSIDAAVAQATNVGLVRFAHAMREVAVALARYEGGTLEHAAVSELRDGESAVFEALANAELAGQMGTDGSDEFSYTMMYRQWHADKSYEVVAQLTTLATTLVASATEIIDRPKEFERTLNKLVGYLRSLYHVSLHFNEEAAGQASMMLLDLVERVRVGEMAFEPELPLTLAQFGRTMGKMVETFALGQDGRAAAGQAVSAVKALVGDYGRSTNVGEGSELLESLGLPSYLLEVMTEESWAELRLAIQKKETFYSVRGDLERDEELTLELYQWLREEDVRVVTSGTLYVNNTTHFEFVISSALSKTLLETSLPKTGFEPAVFTLTAFGLEEREPQTSQISAPNVAVATPASAPVNEPVALTSSPESAPVAPAPTMKPAEAAKKTPAPAKTSGSGKDARGGSYLRVDARKVGALMDLTGELGLAIGSVLHSRETVQADDRDDYDEQAAMDRVEAIIRELQDSVLGLRLIPISGVFQRMQRAVRDLIRETGKQVNFVTEGEDTELDKVMVDALPTPLVHLIRNAVDHGIESPEDRVAAGKSDHGTVKLTAKHQGSEIHVVIQDDGRGLNRASILRRARERGLVGMDEEPDDQSLWLCIFQPGFSTKEKVTDLSGRGVGMDVVMSTVRQLGGRVQIQTEPGRGTTTTMVLPLTVAFMDAMVVRSEERLYSVPLEGVQEVLVADAKSITRLEHAKRDVLRVREDLIPILWLQEFYNEPISDASVDGRVILILTTARGRLGIPIDELVGNQQIVLKPLEAPVDQIKAAVGYGLLRTGEITVALDCEELNVGIR